MSRWNVVTRGRVVGEVLANEYAEALRAARDVYGAGVRVSAPGQPSVERGGGKSEGWGVMTPVSPSSSSHCEDRPRTDRRRAERSGGTA